MPKKISELQSAELKFRALLNKRDEINEQASVLRSERDSLNEQKRGAQDEIRTARDQRDALVTQMRVHKAKRDELQRKAKELIEFKKKLKGAPLGDLKAEIRGMDAELKAMVLRHQTVPMKIPEERTFLDKIRARTVEIQRLKKILAEQDKIHKEIHTVDQSIDALFKQADKEHAEVVRLSEESHEHHAKVTELMKSIAGLVAASNKKHEDFLKLKAGADAAHQKAVEMRSKVIEIKREKQAERYEERKAVRDVNLATRKALDDKHLRDKAADDALQTLFKRGKIEIR